MVGGFTQNGRQANPTATGLYIPARRRYCNLPALPYIRYRHTVTGLTTCQGDGLFGGSNIVPVNCETFNTATGLWETSYTFSTNRHGHVAWQTSQGILLMGGATRTPADTPLDETTLLLSGGGHQPGPFTLVR